MKVTCITVLCIRIYMYICIIPVCGANASKLQSHSFCKYGLHTDDLIVLLFISCDYATAITLRLI